MVFIGQKRERQNVGHVTPKSSVHSALLIFGMVVPDILTASTFQDQNEKSSIWSYLAFLQFFRLLNPEIAISPYFFGLVHFDRILELGEQTGPLQEIFKNFLKMVPFCPRFFSY